MYFSLPNVSSPSSEGAMWWEDLRTLSPPEAPVPILRPEGHQDANSNVGRDVQQVSESSPEPPTTSDANVLSAATVSTPLSLQCRMCNASPTVGSRPVAAMCGHIFCSEYVSKSQVVRLLDSLSAGVSHNTSFRPPGVLCATIPSCYIVCSDSISRSHRRNTASVTKCDDVTYL